MISKIKIEVERWKHFGRHADCTNRSQTIATLSVFCGPYTSGGSLLIRQTGDGYGRNKNATRRQALVIRVPIEEAIQEGDRKSVV